MAPVPATHFENFQGYDDITYKNNDMSNTERLPKVDAVIREMFSQTQKDVYGATAFHNHPVVLMVVNFMQKAHTWSWREKSVQATIFPGLRQNTSPNHFDIEGVTDRIFKESGTYGLLAKCFYNRCSGYNGRLNDGKFNDAISALNSYFNGYTAHLFAEYLRYAYGLTPLPSNVTQYQSLLLSRAYRMLKRAQIASGSWNNPSMEIFIHFVKLLACGASMSEISSTYNSLTSGDYAVRGGVFPSITPSSWMLYRGWLDRGYLDWGDLNAKNLEDEWEVWVPYPSSTLLVRCFANWFDYWKPTGGSCFSADTLVVLADGSTREFSKIQKGDKVRSRTFRTSGGHTTGTASVGFVSKPRRAQRALYSFHDTPHVKFTDTHPIVEIESSESNGHLVLKFVDPNLASTTNPSWQSITALRIPLDGVDRHDGAGSSADEVLYDLVFEPGAPGDTDGGAGPTAFTVADPNGRSFEVASEAPVFEWFPFSMKFFESLLRTVLHNNNRHAAPMAASLVDPDIVVHVPWRELANEAWTRIQSSLPTDITQQEAASFSPGSILSLPRSEGEGALCPQAIADAFESLHSMLGRNVSHEISIGWAYQPSAGLSAGGTAPATVLFVDSLHFLGTTVPPMGSSGVQMLFQVHISRNGEQLSTHDVNSSRRGWQTFECHYAVDISACTSDTDPDGHEFWDIGVEIYDALPKATYRGRSPLYEDAMTLVGLGSTAGDEHAIVDLRILRVGRDVLGQQASWDTTKRVAFAEALGECFAGTLVEQLTQAPASGASRLARAEYAKQANVGKVSG